VERRTLATAVSRTFTLLDTILLYTLMNYGSPRIAGALIDPNSPTILLITMIKPFPSDCALNNPHRSDPAFTEYRVSTPKISGLKKKQFKTS
jgi:hypothetical protein